MVIGSGSVVMRDIPSGVIAAGNPCKVIRKITQQNKEKWSKEYNNYKKEIENEILTCENDNMTL